jgi:Glycosidases
LTLVFDEIATDYYRLYPGEDKAFQGLKDIMISAIYKRTKVLKLQDEKGISWVNDGNTVGMMLYVDLFSDDLAGLMEKVWYFKNLGITLIHLMPILEKRSGENDGGYAVKNYREIDPILGDMKIFEKLVAYYHQNGIKICIDYVINHTANDHQWALKALNGEEKYQAYYYMYDTDEIPKRFEETINQVFPTIAPGNFTYLTHLKKWVMTTFYPFQWDLNYNNPQVLNELVDVLLYLANKGVDMIRLDAIPYVWKSLGTLCRNLPEVHTVLAIFRKVINACAPSVAILGEAIVQPETIVTYFGLEDALECHTLYNASYMVEIWNAIATRDARHIAHMPRYKVPSESVWINYARCHDDIGWGLDAERISALGFDPHAHKMFLIDFYLGSLKDSFSRGELYEYNPVTLDARNSGTLSSLAGLERALNENDRYQLELALKRIELIHAMFILRAGIPMIYAGDELGTLNDYSYKLDAHKCHDSRWLHRSKFDWLEAEKLEDVHNPKALVYKGVKSLIEIRKKIYNDVKVLEEEVLHFGNHHLLGFLQHTEGEALPTLLIYNLSEDRQWLYTSDLKRYGLSDKWLEMLQGKVVNFAEDTIILGPYEYFLLKYKK